MQTLIDVWRQVLAENAKVIELGTERYPVRQTTKSRLRQVDFVCEGTNIRGLEQNPNTAPLAEMARSGDKVMQFSSDGCQWQMWLWKGESILQLQYRYGVSAHVMEPHTTRIGHESVQSFR
jgi:hypothetical protein